MALVLSWIPEGEHLGESLNWISFDKMHGEFSAIQCDPLQNMQIGWRAHYILEALWDLQDSPLQFSLFCEATLTVWSSDFIQHSQRTPMPIPTFCSFPFRAWFSLVRHTQIMYKMIDFCNIAVQGAWPVCHGSSLLAVSSLYLCFK